MKLAEETLTNSRSKEIAKTIINQIKTTYRMALITWGVRNIVALREETRGNDFYLGGVQFDVNGLKFKGKVIIRLHARDVYEVEVGSIKKVKVNGMVTHKWVVHKEDKDVFCDELYEVIDQIVSID